MSKKFVQADGTQRQLKGYKRSAPKRNDATYSKEDANLSRLPNKVDLRPFMTEVENQGDTMSCTANATAGAYEYLLKRHQGDMQDVSRLFMYYNARYVADSDNITDEGATISDVIEGLKEYGACTEPTWEFNEESVDEEPHEEAYDEGTRFLVESAKLVPVELEAWKTALADGQPIIFGLSLYDSFDKHRKPGLVPAPSASEVSRDTHSGHAMLCVGYSDPDQVFIVRNSWGTDWGDKGYCYIPYRYMMNSDYNDGDSWIIERLEVLPPDEETWSEDEESVLEEISTVLSEMDEEEYEALVEGMGDYHLEQRLALIFLFATGADGEFGDDELEAIKGYLEPVLEQTGGNQNAARILKYALKLIDEEENIDEIVDESIDLFWQYFDYDVLASITSQIEAAASADGLNKAEREFIDDLTARWQAEEEESDEEEQSP
jgi:hypothetical protein